MPNTLVVVAHPSLDSSRVNKHWTEALLRHPELVTVNDLYTKYPDGHIDVATEQALLVEHTRIVLQFPMYWFSAPSLLKQWIDDVFAYGWAYGPNGDKLSGKEFSLAISMGGAQEAYQAGGRNRYTVSELTKWLEQAVDFVHGRFLPTHVIHGVVHDLTDEVLEQNTLRYLEKLCA